MEKRIQPPKLHISRTRTLIHLFIIIFVLFSSNSVVGQSMEDLFDAMKTKEEVENFANDPKGFLKDKLKDEVKNKLKDAAFGKGMSVENMNAFKKVFDHHKANTVGGACPLAAHGNAYFILEDLKNRNETTWLPKALFGQVGSILSIQKDLVNFLKDKAKDKIQESISEFFKDIPFDSFSDTGTKQGCDYRVVANIDYARRVWEVVIVANCKCQPIRIPLRKGHGVVLGWKLFATGSLILTPNNNFKKATIGSVNDYKFFPSCNCKEESNTDMFEDIESYMDGNNVNLDDEPEWDCEELAKRIAETEKELSELKKKKKSLLSNSNDENMSDLNRYELMNLDETIFQKISYLSGLLSAYEKYCNVTNAAHDKLTPVLKAYFISAFKRWNGSRYIELDEEGQKKFDEDLKKAKEDEKSNVREGEKVGSAWSPPTGTTRIAAVGTVRNEKVMITSRGSIGGTVTLKDEGGEKLAIAVPDENGHFNIDFGDIGVAVASTLILTRLDSKGKELTSTTVEYLPEIPSEIAGPPVVTQPEIPYLENNQINELEGENFGEGTEVVITNEQGEDILQETLSTSTNSTRYYMDGMVGPAKVRVRNEFGNSELIEIGIYEFNVRAEKMALIRNEKTSLAGIYKGLPEGTRIVFTNMSENVTIKPDGKAKVSGNDVTFTVKEKGREVKLNLKARKAGGWKISYRLEFPESY